MTIKLNLKIFVDYFVFTKILHGLYSDKLRMYNDQCISLVLRVVLKKLIVKGWLRRFKDRSENTLCIMTVPNQRIAMHVSH